MSEPQRQAENAAQHDQGATYARQGAVAGWNRVWPCIGEQCPVEPVAQHAAECDQATFVEDNGQFGWGDNCQTEQQGDGDQRPEGHAGRAGLSLRCGGCHWDTRGEFMVARSAASC